jgi:hypothetical protein
MKDTMWRLLYEKQFAPKPEGKVFRKRALTESEKIARSEARDELVSSMRERMRY